MSFPDDLKYTDDHEWVKIEGTVATVGVTAHAAEQLGDIVYVELPKDGDEIKRGDTFGVLESVKAVSDCYSPLSGKILETNSNLLSDTPSTVNEDPYSEGWMIKIAIEDESELGTLMDHKQYAEFVEEEK